MIVMVASFIVVQNVSFSNRSELLQLNQSFSHVVWP